jgi:hypothetical protein
MPQQRQRQRQQQAAPSLYVEREERPTFCGGLAACCLYTTTRKGGPLLLYVHVDHRPDVGVAGGEAVGRPRAAMRHALSQERRSQEKPATPQRAPSWCHHPE